MTVTGAEGPRRAKIRLDPEQLGFLLELPYDLEPVTLHLVHDPDAVHVIVQGPALDPVLPGTEMPYLSLGRYAVMTDGDGVKWFRRIPGPVDA